MRAIWRFPAIKVFGKEETAAYRAYVAKPTVSAGIGRLETLSGFLCPPSPKTWPRTVDPGTHGGKSTMWSRHHPMLPNQGSDMQRKDRQDRCE